MVGVVAIHLVARIAQDSALHPVGRWLDHASRFGVPLFLAAAGSMLAAQAQEVQDWQQWLLRRLRAVVPAYLVWALIYGAVAPLDGQGMALWGGELAWPARLLSVVFGYGAEQLYFMTAYLGLLLVAPLVGLVLQRLTTSAISALVMLAVALAALAANTWLLAQCSELVQVRAPLHGIAGWLLQTEARTPLHWFGFYLCGVALGQLQVSGLRMPPALYWLAVPAALLHGWIALRSPLATQFDDFWCSPALVASSITFALWGPPLAKRLDNLRLGGWLAVIGRESLGIYLAHVLFLRLSWAATAALPLPVALGLTVLGTLAGTAAYLPLHRRLFTPPAVAATA